MVLANISNSPAASPGYSPAKAAKLDLASVPLADDDEPSSPPPPPPAAAAGEPPLTVPTSMNDVKRMCRANQTLVVGNAAFGAIWLGGDSLFTIALSMAMAALIAGYVRALLGSTTTVRRFTAADATPYADAAVDTINRGAGLVERVFLCGDAAEALQALVLLRALSCIAPSISLYWGALIGFNAVVAMPMAIEQVVEQMPNIKALAKAQWDKLGPVVSENLLQCYANNPTAFIVGAGIVSVGAFCKLSYFDEALAVAAIGLGLKASKAAQTHQMVAAGAVAAAVAAGNFKEFAKRRMSFAPSPRVSKAKAL
jgi:hypothetical protein